MEKTQYQALAHLHTHIIVQTYTIHTRSHTNITCAHANSCAHVFCTYEHQERKSKPRPSRVVFSHGSCFSLGGYTEEEACATFCEDHGGWREPCDCDGQRWPLPVFHDGPNRAIPSLCRSSSISTPSTASPSERTNLHRAVGISQGNSAFKLC